MKPEAEPNWRSLFETTDEYNKQCLETIRRQQKLIERFKETLRRNGLEVDD